MSVRLCLTAAHDHEAYRFLAGQTRTIWVASWRKRSACSPCTRACGPDCGVDRTFLPNRAPILAPRLSATNSPTGPDRQAMQPGPATSTQPCYPSTNVSKAPNTRQPEQPRPTRVLDHEGRRCGGPCELICGVALRQPYLLRAMLCPGKRLMVRLLSETSVGIGTNARDTPSPCGVKRIRTKIDREREASNGMRKWGRGETSPSHRDRSAAREVIRCHYVGQQTVRDLNAFDL